MWYDLSPVISRPRSAHHTQFSVKCSVYGEFVSLSVQSWKHLGVVWICSVVSLRSQIMLSFICPTWNMWRFHSCDPCEICGAFINVSHMKSIALSCMWVKWNVWWLMLWRKETKSSCCEIRFLITRECYLFIFCFTFFSENNSVTNFAALAPCRMVSRFQWLAQIPRKRGEGGHSRIFWGPYRVFSP